LNALNPIVETCTIHSSHSDELEGESNMFKVGASFEESFQEITIAKLYLFMRLYSILPIACENHVISKVA